MRAEKDPFAVFSSPDLRAEIFDSLGHLGLFYRIIALRQLARLVAGTCAS